MNIDFAAINDVIQLADEWARAENLTPHTLSMNDLENYLKNPDVTAAKECHRALEKYMRKLNYEIILDIETLMLLGRDHEYSETDTYERRFNRIRKDIAEQYSNPDNIEMAIDYITGKWPLAEYLKDGLKAIGH